MVELSAASFERDAAPIERLLWRVYVEGGFTAAALAESVFQAAAVFARGQVIVARDVEQAELLGVVIMVPQGSPARRLAADDQAEMHLLGVLPGQRNAGLGGRLVQAALAAAQGHRGMLLWTQSTMLEAQRVYLRHGFERVAARDFETHGRSFLVFEKELSPGLKIVAT